MTLLTNATCFGIDSACGDRLACQEEDMGNLVFVCPATGVEVSTGIEMDVPTLKQLESEEVSCPYCRQTHRMAGIKYWLARPSEDDTKAA